MLLRTTTVFPVSLLWLKGGKYKEPKAETPFCDVVENVEIRQYKLPADMQQPRPE